MEEEKNNTTRPITRTDDTGRVNTFRMSRLPDYILGVTEGGCPGKMVSLLQHGGWMERGTVYPRRPWETVPADLFHTGVCAGPHTHHGKPEHDNV